MIQREGRSRAAGPVLMLWFLMLPFTLQAGLLTLEDPISAFTEYPAGFLLFWGPPFYFLRRAIKRKREAKLSRPLIASEIAREREAVSACPRCKVPYREGIDECSDCRVRLVLVEDRQNQGDSERDGSPESKE